MPAAQLQLVSNSVLDLFLTHKPQISFFKTIFRRCTNFAKENIVQNFINTPKLGKTSICSLTLHGDLISKMNLCMTLPSIPEFIKNNISDPITKFAWSKYIGFVLIKSISIIIDDKIIDKHYMTWFFIYNQLLGSFNNNQFNKMIGHVPELYNFTSSKKSYSLKIPLHFWFCNSYGNSLPIVSMVFSSIKVNLELNDSSKLFIVAPSHYIQVIEDVCNFINYEYITQTINNTTITTGIFIYFDQITQYLYYHKLSSTNFISKSDTNNLSLQSLNTTYYYNNLYENYRIIGNSSLFYMFPKINSSAQSHSYYPLPNVELLECYLLVEYIYLEAYERKKIANENNTYLITQIQIFPPQKITGQNMKLNISLFNPIKFIVWFVQNNILTNTNNNDFFNFTDNYIYENDNLIGESFIIEEYLSLNNIKLYNHSSKNYYNYIQPLLYIGNDLPNGLNLLSFALDPLNHSIPSGSCNFSVIDYVSINLKLSQTIDLFSDVKFSGFALNTNILIVKNGIVDLLFVN